jgi:hypothetical protein
LAAVRPSEVLFKESTVRRPLIATAALAVIAAVVCTSLGIAQSEVFRASTDKVTAATTPRQDRVRPYTFTTRGRIVPPPKVCAPGQTPSPASNCIPLICPPKATNPEYCFGFESSAICAGVVNVRFQKVHTTVSSRNVSVRSDCTYRSRVSFRLNLRTRRDMLRVRARFQGNQVLAPKNSSTHTVRAG